MWCPVHSQATVTLDDVNEEDAMNSDDLVGDGDTFFEAAAGEEDEK